MTALAVKTFDIDANRKTVFLGSMGVFFSLSENPNPFEIEFDYPLQRQELHPLRFFFIFSGITLLVNASTSLGFNVIGATVSAFE